jgi:hypothetical protein
VLFFERTKNQNLAGLQVFWNNWNRQSVDSALFSNTQNQRVFDYNFSSTHSQGHLIKILCSLPLWQAGAAKFRYHLSFMEWPILGRRKYQKYTTPKIRIKMNHVGERRFVAKNNQMPSVALQTARQPHGIFLTMRTIKSPCQTPRQTPTHLRRHGAPRRKTFYITAPSMLHTLICTDPSATWILLINLCSWRILTVSSELFYRHSKLLLPLPSFLPSHKMSATLVCVQLLCKIQG